MLQAGSPYMRRFFGILASLACLCIQVPAHAADGNYKNFRVAVYIRVHQVQEFKDPNWLPARWDALTREVKVDKVYMETYRDDVVADEQAIVNGKKFFESRGVEVAGGIAAVHNEPNRFQVFCYSPEDRPQFKQIVEFTARHFNELILDDFFFTTCKNDWAIQAKGDKSWAQFRLALMDDVAENTVVKAAKAVNPKIKVVIKFPNWYEHFQDNGFDLAVEPKIFDGIYTGTETRDPVYNDQHLQEYESYEIIRYFSNIKPGGNGGGWVDIFNARSLDRYAEQLRLTLLAKAPEITLFSLGDLVQPIRDSSGVQVPATLVGRVAGYTLEEVDGFLGNLGNPVGVKSYKPPNSSGEDFLHNYIGMLGIPMEMVPAYPTDAKTIFLTASAAFDPQIVDKVKESVRGGGHVIITSGLLKKLAGKGLNDIAELQTTDQKIAVDQYMARFRVVQGTSKILFPEILFATNDAWSDVSGVSGAMGYPILVEASYGKGVLYVLAIPDNVADLYLLPADVLDSIKRVMLKESWMRTETPAKIALFTYDNKTAVIGSFLDSPELVTIVTDKSITKLQDFESGRVLNGEPRGAETVFHTFLQPHRFQMLSAQ